MTTTKTSPVEKDFALYDVLCVKRRELHTQVEDDGRILRAVSDTAVSGGDFEQVAREAFDRQQLVIICSGIEDACRRIAQRICDTEAEARGVDAPTLQNVCRDAAALREHIANRLDDAEHTAAAVARRREERTAYSRAFDEFSTIRGELLRAGREPLRASEEAKERMECDPADLWPANSPGTLQLTGRALDSTVTPPYDPADAEENRRERQADLKVTA